MSATAIVALVGPALLVATRGVTDSTPASITGWLAVLLALLMSIWRWLPTRCEGGRARASFFVWLVACGFGAWQLGSIAVFMDDVSRTEMAFVNPRRTFDDEQLNGSLIPRHNCFTSYMVAAQLATERAENIYDASLYASAENENRTIVHEQIGSAVSIDFYPYPPPFLLLPKALMLVGEDFYRHRSIWFGLEVAFLVVVMSAFAGWISGERFGGAWFGLPAVLLAPEMLTTLQIGNVHFMIFCLAMGGMLALEHGRPVLGGLLLAFSIMGKIFPLLLLIYLAARRRWRGLLYTCGAIALYAALTLAVFGWAPFAAFSSYQLPRLLSGEAFSSLLEILVVKVTTLSVAGIPPKLSLLGLLDADPNRIATLLSWVFSIFLLVIPVVTGMRHHRVRPSKEETGCSRRTSAILAASWLSMLVLAQMRSPLLPWVYGSLPALWLVVLFALGTRRWSPLWFLPVWAVLATPMLVPIGPPTPTLDLYFTLIAQLITLALAVVATLRAPIPTEDVRTVVRGTSQPIHAR